MEHTRALIVEDEFIVAKDLHARLEKLGYAVCGCVNSGEKAIAHVEQTPTDIVLMDIMLKGEMTGIEASNQIREQFRIPVIYVAANTNPDIVARTKITEPFGFIMKPFNERELQENIEMALYKNLMEEQLRKSEEKYRQVVENANEVIIVVQNERVVYANPASTAILGHSQEESLNRPFIELIHPEDRKLVLDRHRRRLQGEQVPDPYSARVVHKTGSIRWLEVRTVVIEWEEKPATLVLLSDITGREQAEQALRKSELNLAQVQQIANLGSWEYDRTTETLTLSRECCRVFGIEPQEGNLTYSSMFNMIPSEDRKAVMADYEAAIQNHVPYDGVHRILRQSDGAIRYVHDKCEFITDEAGKIVRLTGILHDITDQERAKQQVEQERLRYKLLLEAYHDGIAIMNHDYRVVEANRRFAEMLGYTPEEVLNLHVWDWEAVMTESEICANFPNDTQASTVFETRHRRKDGTVFDAEVSVCVTRVGEEVLAFSVSRDITERKRVEQSLEQERLRYKLLLEAYRDGIAIINQDHQIVEANRCFAERLGYTREETLNLHIWDWEAAMTESEIRADFADISTTDIVFETRHRRKDGTMFDVEVSACGTLVGEEAMTFTISRDITERKRMQKSLEQEMRRRKSLMEGYHDGIVIISINQDHRVVEANRRFAEMLGYTPEEVLMLHTWDWEAVMTKSEIRANFPDSISLNNVFETRHRRKDGTAFDVEVSSYAETLDGEMLVLCICRDITERKRIEEELRQYRERLEESVQERTAELTLANQQLHEEIVERKRMEMELSRHREHLEELVNERTRELLQEITERQQAEHQLTLSLQEKSILLREIHHRVKNNLQIISSLLNLQAPLLKDEYARSLFRESQQRVRTMALIHEKLYQSKSLREIDFQEYVQSLTSELHASYQSLSGPVELVVDVAVIHLDLDTAIPCGLILTELLSNAFKYGIPSEHGKIMVTFSVTSDRDYELRVSDNGTGLPPEINLDTLDSLGLQLVKGLVEQQLDGTLELCRSSGTTWIVRFHP